MKIDKKTIEAVTKRYVTDQLGHDDDRHWHLYAADVEHILAAYIAHQAEIVGAG